MTASTLIFNQFRYREPTFFLAGLLISSSLLLTMLLLDFHNQYLHNPDIHIFFQAKGIFLF